LELTVGISKMQPSWSIVLDQIGVPYQEVDVDRPIDPEKIAVVILSSEPIIKQKENLIQFQKSGGGILTEANHSAMLLNHRTEKANIKYIYSNQDSFFSTIPLCDLEMECEIASNAQHLPNQDGVKTIAIQNYQNGQIVILPSNFCNRLIESKTITRKNFPSPIQKFSSERVSRISTGGIRHIIQQALKYLFHGRELPFVQTWFFPNGEKNIFAFRIDTDSASKAEIEELYQLCRKNDISATWFVDTKSHKSWIDHFSKMENQEIGYHCYNHHVYPDSRANQMDMEKGLSILKKVNIKPTGYAAPFGEWNCSLNQLIQEKGFEYSSEFGCAYDDLPFFPYGETNFSKTLQVPIHPVSTRRLQLAKHSEKQMVEYYLGIIQQKLFLNDPTIFYDHPVHGHSRIFEPVFKEVRNRNIPNMTLHDYQTWWRKRLDARWQATHEKGKLSIRSSKADPSIWMKVTYPDNREFLMPLDNPGKQIPFKKNSPPSNFPDCSPKDLRRYNLKMFWHDIQSRYGKLR
jgi:hypothetical protein